MARKSDEKFEMTSEELERLHEAMKKEEFRKLLVEYAEEISNPENRKKYEEEIAMLESERGVDVKFIHPHPGYVLRSCADGARKAFINVAQNDAIERASLDRASGGARGVHWNIPHSFAPPRDDRDKSGAKCSVFDVVFHPDTLRMALSNAAFKRAIDSTALEGIERQFGVQLDRSNVKTMKKLKFKGKPTATVIRKTKENCPPAAAESDADNPLGRLPYPYGTPSSGSGGGGDGAPLTPPHEPQPQERKQSSETGKPRAAASAGDDDGYAIPKHTIVNRYHADMTDFATNLTSPAVGNSRPRALVVEVSLPLLSSAAGVTLDVLDRKLSLKSDAPARYKLDLALPYPVDDVAGSAKFDKRKKCLVVTLPVVPAQPQAPVDSAALPMPPSSANCCVDTGPTDEVSRDRNPARIDASGSTIDVNQDGDSPRQQWSPDDARQAVGEAAISAACSSGRAVPAAVCSDCSGHNDCNVVDSCSTASNSQDGDKTATAAGTGAGMPTAGPADLVSSLCRSSSDAMLLSATLPDESASVGSAGSSSGDGSSGVNAPDASAIKYMMPQFSYDQDDLQVTFVVEVKNIKADSVRVVFGVDRQAADEAVTPERAGSDAAAGCSTPCSGSFVATFCSIGSGYFPMHYSLAVRFPAGCQIVGNGCAVDVSVRNAVLIFRKSSSSSGTWQNFQCARTVEELAADAGETKDFATLENLQAELNLLEKQCTEAKQLDSCQSAAASSSTGAGAIATAAARSLYVKSLRDECLSINIKELDSSRPEPTSARSAAAGATAVSAAASSCRRRHHRDDDEVDDDEDDSALSSPEIIYNKEPPRDLQGILKKQRGDSSSSSSSSSSGSSCPSDGPDEAAQGGASSSDGGLTRSISGGTGGVSSDGGISSPDSSDENGSSALTQRKKAVTFNDHVDETAYQPSAAVTMLHQTLKNKRKRQKKKEDRKQHAATVAEGRRRRRNSSSGSITTDEEEVVAAAVSEAATASGLQASVSSAARHRSSQHANSPRIADTVVSSLAANAATPQIVTISESNLGDGACGISSDRTAIVDVDVATSSIDTSCREVEMAADLSKPDAVLSKATADLLNPAANQSKQTADVSNPTADLAKPAADLSKPAADLSKPAANLSKHAADMSKQAAATNHPFIDSSADVDRVEIRERGTAGHNGAAGEGDAARQIAPNHRGTSGVPQLAPQSPGSIGGRRLPSQTPSADSSERRCNAAAADSDDDERDAAADPFAESSGSSGSPAMASVGCRAAVSHNEHATKCSFAFRNSIAYELD